MTDSVGLGRLYEQIHALVARPMALMEVCGSHTMAIGRFGLRSRMPADLRLISGPGCPVCVTAASYVDHAIALSREPGVVVTTFGDMLRVPGSESSLATERGRGAQVRVLYSPADALAIAQAEPALKVVFLGVGFETTSPTIAATVLRASALGLKNFFVLPAFKVVPPAMEALAAAGEIQLDGFICPGHVSALIGEEPYRPIAEKYGLPCVITGFDAPEMLRGILALLTQRVQGRAWVENEYPRAVRSQGNPHAMALLARVFEPCDATWRGIGDLPLTGLGFRKEYSAFDASLHLPVELPEPVDLPRGCGCGEVMRGLKTPPECVLFGCACTPARPVGPCMVSSEGACAAWYKYGDHDRSLAR